MSGHHHHEHSGSGLVAAARTALLAQGEQWTDMRADVFAALAGQTRPVSAYDVADSVSAARARRVAANSVYRILDLFVRTNLARRIESANAYVANPHPGCRHDCMFLICDACGGATHVDDDTLSATLREAARGAGFAEVRPVIELRGICALCSAEPALRDPPAHAPGGAIDPPLTPGRAIDSPLTPGEAIDSPLSSV